MSDQTPTTKQIVERHIKDVTWRGLKGYCHCPGEHLHTTGGHGKKDCIIYADSIPTVYCFHEHCQELISDMNRTIREEWSVFQPEIPADELEKAKAIARHRHELEHRAKLSLPTILKDYVWSEREIESTGALNKDAEHQWRLFLNLFHDDDTLWVGQPEDTGHYRNSVNFRRVKELKLLPGGPQGNFTCMSVFRRGSTSRANANVLSTPYLVVEGDQILGAPKTAAEKQHNRDACGAVFRYLQECLGLKLRVVIDSGNKSLHGWFEMPPKNVYDELKIVLPAMGCDRAMFKPSQPVRAPGAVRRFEDGTEKYQGLLYYV
jgi:hypothetical protein